MLKSDEDVSTHTILPAKGKLPLLVESLHYSV